MGRRRLCTGPPWVITLALFQSGWPSQKPFLTCKLVMRWPTSQVPLSTNWNNTLSPGPVGAQPILTIMVIPVCKGRSPTEPLWQVFWGPQKSTSVVHRTNCQSVFEAYTALPWNLKIRIHPWSQRKKNTPAGEREVPGAHHPLPAPSQSCHSRTWSPGEGCTPHLLHSIERVAFMFQTKAFICGFYLQSCIYLCICQPGGMGPGTHTHTHQEKQDLSVDMHS